MFCRQSTVHSVWNSFPFLAWDLSMHPRTQIWIFNQVICTGACACSSNLNYAHKCIKTQLMHKNVQMNPKKSKKLTQHSCCSMLTLGKKLNREEAMNIVSSRKMKCSLPKPSGLLWEALVCEKHIPKPAPNGTKNLPRHVDAAPW